MWDPRLMCLNECFYFILEVWVEWGHVAVILFILFLSKILFFVNDSTSQVFPSFLAEYEVAKAATLWLFSHGVGGVERHGGRGGNISNTEYLEIVRGCVHVMSIEQSQWSCELFCRTKGVQRTIKSLLHVQKHSFLWTAVNMKSSHRQNPLLHVCIKLVGAKPLTPLYWQCQWPTVFRMSWYYVFHFQMHGLSSTGFRVMLAIKPVLM